VCPEHKSFEAENILSGGRGYIGSGMTAASHSYARNCELQAQVHTTQCSAVGRTDIRLSSRDWSGHTDRCFLAST
jgi:hypothetical protein